MATVPEVLRWGVICDGTELPAWQARCLDELHKKTGSAPAILVVDAPSGADARQRGASLWSWYGRRAAARSKALCPVDRKAAFAGTPTLTRAQSGAFTAAEIEQLRAHDLDFILHLSSAVPRGAVRDVPRHGVWSFQHGEGAGGAELPHLREVARGDTVTRVMLRRLEGRDGGGAVLHQGSFPVMPGSYTTTVDQACFGITCFPALVCGSLQRRGSLPSIDGEAPISAEAPRPPDNREMSAHFARLAWRQLRGHYEWAFRAEQWSIGVVHAPVEAFLQDGFRPVTWWLPTQGRGRYLADPFAIPEGGGLTVFAEDFDYRTERGHISFVADMAGGSPETAIELPEHMSYPYLVRHGGEVYCIPEASQTREVRLFRARSFPRDWEMVGVLVKDFAAVDSTVFQHEGRWWLLCCDCDTGSWTALHAFHAPDLTGPWEPHAANPVKVDVRSSRPAGRPFVAGGQLYRPAQDCSRSYGGAVAVNRVLLLTPTEFAEEVVRVIEPDEHGPFPDGLHTLSSVNDVTLIDGKRMIFIGEVFRRSMEQRWANAVSRLRRRIAGGLEAVR